MASPIEPHLLLDLYYCSLSSKKGMEDQGFPGNKRILDAKGYVKKGLKGWKITEDGQAYLMEYWEEVKKL